MANCFKVFHNNELYAIVGTPFTAKTVDGVKYVPMPYITPRGHREYPCWGCVFIPDTEEGRLQYVIAKLES